MTGLEKLQKDFESYFNHRHFPASPASLYDPLEVFLSNSGKRIRPVLCLLSNSLYGEINENAYHLAAAIELFHNFTLVHDDIMDKAPLRRGKPTVHAVHGEPTALLGGDVMMVVAYDYIMKIPIQFLKPVLDVFNKTAKEVCEGQQLDMDFEKSEEVSLYEYVNMITLKTSVLLACSLQLGAILANASADDQFHLYEFGKNLGIAFQIQDDYLDAFGDPAKFGKQVGGDIQSNKKTFLMIHALETASEDQKKTLKKLMVDDPSDKVQQVLEIFRSCKIDQWSTELKEAYLDKSLAHLNQISIPAEQKKSLIELAHYLINRDK